MKNKATITMAFEDTDQRVRHMLPSTEGIKVKLLEIQKSALSESLKHLASDLAEILNGINSPVQGVRLRQVGVAVQFTTEGGIAWIASAKTGLTNSMTLTFEVEPGPPKVENPTAGKIDSGNPC